MSPVYAPCLIGASVGSDASSVVGTNPLHRLPTEQTIHAPLDILVDTMGVVTKPGIA